MITANPDIPDIPNSPDVETPLSSGPARPVVLFPVRLETRFFSEANGECELRVRVYPDSVHIDSHEPALTDDESAWGQHFWEQMWRAANDAERRKAVWRQLADRFDPPRAAWIVRALKPLNAEDRPEGSVPSDQPLERPVRFPSPPSKAETWTRAPEARALPDFWVVLGYKAGRLVVNVKGRLIPGALPAGPDPSPSAKVDQFGIDEGMRWIVDFDAAERLGMGIRARLAQEVADAGLDFLLVMGVKDSPDSAAGQGLRLEELFNAHHYTNGLSFVPPGTPSNNTPDAPSGFSSSDPSHEITYLAECAMPAFRTGDGSNADLLTTALGLSSAGQVFANLPHAMSGEERDARQMNTALWEATWGYFLLQMLGVGKTSESPLTDGDIAWVRRHFIDYVRANGPFPAVRVGKQPYGVLPVTSIDAWKPKSGHETESKPDMALRDFLIRLRGLWRSNYPEIPRLGRSEIEKDLAEVLSMDALSSSYSIRHLIGRQYLEHLYVFLSANSSLNHSGPFDNGFQFTQAQFRSWFSQQAVLSAKALNLLGMTWRPRLARAVFSPPVATLEGALIQAGQGLSLSPNYIEAMLAARDLKEIAAAQDGASRSLLYLLLRHSMLLEYTTAASNLLIKRGLLDPALRREPELVDLSPGSSTLTGWRLLTTKISVMDVAEPMEVGKYLLGFTPSGEPDLTNEPDLRPLNDFRASLAHLQPLSAARLEQLMSGTLDLCSHRLDAWITSFATKRLAEMRKEDPAGVLLGGYGWVMNLKPGPAQAEVAPPAGEQAPIFESSSNPGFVHTPSLAQASTAGILLSGHLAHSGNPNPNDLLAIDLSSERVRVAIWPMPLTLRYKVIELEAVC